MVAQRLPCIGRGGGGGSTMAAASLAAEAAAWRQRDFGGGSSASGSRGRDKLIALLKNCKLLELRYCNSYPFQFLVLQFCVCQYQSIAILCLPKYCNSPSGLFFACKPSVLACFITLFKKFPGTTGIVLLVSLQVKLCEAHLLLIVKI